VLAFFYRLKTSFVRAILLGGTWAAAATALQALRTILILKTHHIPVLISLLGSTVVGLAVGLVYRKVESRLTLKQLLLMSCVLCCLSVTFRYLYSGELRRSLVLSLFLKVGLEILVAGVIFGWLNYARMSNLLPQQAESSSL
jgi:hypothetical protein